MKIQLLISLLLAGSCAFANTDHPQFFYQPDAGQFALSPGLSVVQISSQLEGFLKVETQTTRASVTAEYGFSDSYSLAFSQSFASTNTDNSVTEIDFSGFSDPNFDLKGNHKMGDFTLRYGTNLSFGFAAEEDANGNADNQFSGRNELTPYLGFDYRINKTIFVGAQIRQDILLGKQITEDANGNESKAKGGNTTTVDVFYEHYFGKAGIGALATYAVTSDLEPDGGGKSEFVNLFGLGVYGVFFVTDQMTIIPTLVYATTPDDSAGGADIEEFNIFGFSATARFTF